MKGNRPDGVTLIAVYYFLSAALTLIGSCAIVIFAIVPIVDTVGSGELLFAIFGPLVGLCATLVFAVGGVVAGIGLLRLKEWARWVAIALGVLSLIGVPIGTIIGVLVIWYLLKPEVRMAFTAAGGTGPQ